MGGEIKVISSVSETLKPRITWFEKRVGIFHRIFQNFPMEYSWTITRNRRFRKMEYFGKLLIIDIFGFSRIRYIHGIYQKNCTTSKILHAMKYGIFCDITKDTKINPTSVTMLSLFSLSKSFFWFLTCNIEYSKMIPLNENCKFSGLWNIAKNNKHK